MNHEKKIVCTSNSSEKTSFLTNFQLQPAEPLWKRVPIRDCAGNPYADFMMLISGLKKISPLKMQEVIHKLESVFNLYKSEIIFVDLNFKINILWVTLQPHIGLSSEIAACIHHAVPQAKLISQHAVSSSS